MRRNSRLGLLFVLILVCILYEEVNFGNIQIYTANRYNVIVYRDITIKRDSITRIGILIILETEGDEVNYPLALDSVKCYAEKFNYGIHILYTSTNPAKKICKQKDFMFLRHCILAENLYNLDYEWIFFLDADMGIINPNVLLESFIPNDEKTQLVFYNRIMNHEVMAGSYLLKNGEYARKFLNFWADYFYKLPNSFHGTDNGALHSAIVEFSLPMKEKQRKLCEERFWKTSSGYHTLSIYEVCIQDILKSQKIDTISILPKGRFSWARDGWLTNSVWSDKDFIFHGWQKKRLDKLIFAEWHSPLVGTFNLSLCGTEDAYKNWRYKDSFISSNLVVDRILYITIKAMNEEYEKILRSLL